MAEQEREFKPTLRERLFGLLLQEKFDERYVTQDGDYWIVKALVISCAGLMLTAVILGALAWILHAPK
jgi:hypothetical protein